MFLDPEHIPVKCSSLPDLHRTHRAILADFDAAAAKRYKAYPPDTIGFLLNDGAWGPTRRAEIVRACEQQITAYKEVAEKDFDPEEVWFAEQIYDLQIRPATRRCSNRYVTFMVRTSLLFRYILTVCFLVTGLYANTTNQAWRAQRT